MCDDFSDFIISALCNTKLCENTKNGKHFSA